MFSTAALALFVVFVVELIILVQLAGAFGALLTALAVVALSCFGVVFLRAKGGGLVRSTVARLSGQDKLDSQQLADDLADRAISIVAGLLFVVPGFLTAGLALILLLPPVRAFAKPALLARVTNSAGFNLRFGRSFVDVDTVDTTGSDKTKGSEPPTSAHPELG